MKGNVIKQPSVLILGGTRYVGKRLVKSLREKEWAVTIATRGQAAIPSDDGVRWLPIDRFDRSSLEKALGQGTWDVVYDQLCYAPSDAVDLLETLAHRVGRYIMTSSQMVYGSGRWMPETAFDPWHYPVRLGRRGDFEYGEGKRLAEAVLMQQATFPVMVVRFPAILGRDDYTDRLGAQIRRVQTGQALPIRDMTVEMSLISSAEAAKFLVWQGEQSDTGVINAGSIGAVSVAGIVGLIEGAVKQRAAVVARADNDPFSLLAGQTLTLDTTKAEQAGYEFRRVDTWLPELVQESVEAYKAKDA